jgi:hypothetical protein
MSRPTQTIQRRKRKLKQKADQRREEFKQAKDRLKGNPELVEAVEALEKELDAIREAVDL